MTNTEDVILSGANPQGDARLIAALGFGAESREEWLVRVQRESLGTGRHPVESIDGKDVTGVEKMDRIERSWMSTEDQMRGRYK